MHVRLLVLFCVLALTACSSDHWVQIGVPSAREFDEPVPLMVSDVQIGATGETGLGPDDRPIVVAHIDAKYKKRITRRTEFVLRRKALGLGSRYIEVVPGDGAPVETGHHFFARAGDPTSEARTWWNDFVTRTRDPELRARIDRLQARFAEMVDASRENWQRERPHLEAEAEQILDRLGEESRAAAEEFERWLDAAIEEHEKRTPE